MILGIGNDMIDSRRIDNALKQYGNRFINRLFTLQEQRRMNGRQDAVSGYAKLFALKEAVLKALGTGLAQGIFWRDIDIFREDGCAPRAELSGAALKILQSQTLPDHKAQVYISVSDEWPYAQAFAIISAEPL